MWLDILGVCSKNPQQSDLIVPENIGKHTEILNWLADFWTINSIYSNRSHYITNPNNALLEGKSLKIAIDL